MIKFVFDVRATQFQGSGERSLIMNWAIYIKWPKHPQKDHR